MDRKELDLIKELMDKLSDEMEYSEDDLSERLGRKKPKVEVLSIESKLPMDEESEMEDEMYEESEDFPEMEDGMPIMEEDSPEEALKRRLMKLRK